MRLLSRDLVSLLLLTALAVPIGLTGCRSHGQYQDDSYSQWERDTHREHVDLNKRSAEDRKQYEDWQRNHQEHH